MVHPNDGIRPQRNFHSFYYSPERWRDIAYRKTTALPLHTLIVSPTQSHGLFTIQNNTIHNRVTMIYFIEEIPWENTTVNPTPWVRKTVGQHTSLGEWVYSTPGVQTQLNNISRSGILGSTTNTNLSQSNGGVNQPQEVNSNPTQPIQNFKENDSKPLRPTQN